MRHPLWLLPLLAACAGDPDPAGPDAGPDAGGDPPGFRLDRAGMVAMIEGSGVSAALYDGPIEEPLPEEIATSGDCTVYHRPQGQADFASQVSAGTITITGLRQAATLTPSDFGYTSPALPDDFFADDATIHVDAAGDDVPAFTADVGGVAPLVHQLGGSVEIQDGEDEVVRWTPAGGDAQIQLALYLGWHGAPWTDLLLCETEDDGALVVPAALIQEMPYFEFGLFQWPSWISRFRRAWVTGPDGPIEVIAASQSPLGMSHPMP